MKRRLPVVASVSVGLWLSGNQVCACATCYGASDAPMAHGMNMGILVLLLVVASVLSGIAACFIALAIRARRSAAVLPEVPHDPRAGGVSLAQDWESGVGVRR